MPTNNFLSLANSGGANVLTQSDYAALTSFLANGFSSGIVPSNQMNKVLRQSTVIANLIGEFIKAAGYDALDNGDAAAILQNFQNALSYTVQKIAPQFYTLGTTGTITPDFSFNHNFDIPALTGNITLANPTNVQPGWAGVIKIQQSSSSAKTITFGSAWKFGGGTAPALSTTLNSNHLLSYVCYSSGFIVGNMLKDVA
jgi:hypothetical protein